MSKALTIPLATVELALGMISDGQTLTPIANQLGVNRSTLYDALRRLPERYQAARHAGADALAEEIVDIADTEPDPQRAKVRTDVRRWLASKFLPALYGDKLDLSITRTVDIRDVMAEARNRAGLVRAVEVVDAEVVERKHDTAADALVSSCEASAEQADIFT